VAKDLLFKAEYTSAFNSPVAGEASDNHENAAPKVSASNLKNNVIPRADNGSTSSAAEQIEKHESNSQTPESTVPESLEHWHHVDPAGSGNHSIVAGTNITSYGYITGQPLNVTGFLVGNSSLAPRQDNKTAAVYESLKDSTTNSTSSDNMRQPALSEPRRQRQRRRRLLSSTTHHLRGFSFDGMENNSNKTASSVISRSTKQSTSPGEFKRDSRLRALRHDQGNLLHALFSPIVMGDRSPPRGQQVPQPRVEIVIDLWKGKFPKDNSLASSGVFSFATRGSRNNQGDPYKQDKKVAIKKALAFMQRFGDGDAADALASTHNETASAAADGASGNAVHHRKPIFNGKFCEGNIPATEDGLPGSIGSHNSLLCVQTIHNSVHADDELMRQQQHGSSPANTNNNNITTILQSLNQYDDDIVVNKIKKLLLPANSGGVSNSRQPLDSHLQSSLPQESIQVIEMVGLVNSETTVGEPSNEFTVVSPLHAHIDGWTVPLPVQLIKHIASQSHKQLQRAHEEAEAARIYNRLVKLTGNYFSDTDAATHNNNGASVNINSTTVFEQIGDVLGHINDLNRFDMQQHFHFSYRPINLLMLLGNYSSSSGGKDGLSWSSNIKSTMGKWLQYLVGPNSGGLDVIRYEQQQLSMNDTTTSAPESISDRINTARIRLQRRTPTASKHKNSKIILHLSNNSIVFTGDANILASIDASAELNSIPDNIFVLIV
jgi:hypothetical protein